MPRIPLVHGCLQCSRHDGACQGKERVAEAIDALQLLLPVGQRLLHQAGLVALDALHGRRHGHMPVRGMPAQSLQVLRHADCTAFKWFHSSCTQPLHSTEHSREQAVKPSQGHH